MEILSIPRSVRKIVVVKTEPSGVVTIQEIVGNNRRKKKKQSELLKPIEKLARKMAEARVISAQTYLELHRKANEKKKDGWVKNIVRNKVRSQRRALRKVL